MDRGHTILLILVLIMGVWLLILYSSPSVHERKNEDLQLENAVYIERIKNYSATIRLYKDSLRVRDEKLEKVSKNAHSEAEKVYIKIQAVDTLREDSVYKFLTQRYVKE